MVAFTSNGKSRPSHEDEEEDEEQTSFRFCLGTNFIPSSSPSYSLLRNISKVAPSFQCTANTFGVA